MSQIFGSCGSPGMMVETVVQASSLRGQDARPTGTLHFLILTIPGEPILLFIARPLEPLLHPGAEVFNLIIQALL